MVEFHAEPGVNRVELLLRQRNHLAPDAEIFGVATLELDEFLLGRVPDGLHGVAGGVDQFVEPFHFADGIGLERVGLQVMLPAEQQHPKLRSPVADVIVGDDAVAEQPQRAREAIAENRRADVANVHRLGDVRRAEINDGSSWNRHLACLRLS